MVFALVRRLVGVLAVFSVVFAPAATHEGGDNTPAAPPDADLSGAVLAPTFTSSELAVGRSSEDSADEHDEERAGYALGEMHVHTGSLGVTARAVTETVAAANSIPQAWASRAPPAS